MDESSRQPGELPKVLEPLSIPEPTQQNTEPNTQPLDPASLSYIKGLKGDPEDIPHPRMGPGGTIDRPIFSDSHTRIRFNREKGWDTDELFKNFIKGIEAEKANREAVTQKMVGAVQTRIKENMRTKVEEMLPQLRGTTQQEAIDRIANLYVDETMSVLKEVRNIMKEDVESQGPESEDQIAFRNTVKEYQNAIDEYSRRTEELKKTGHTLQILSEQIIKKIREGYRTGSNPETPQQT